jgi:hypothetical protein
MPEIVQSVPHQDTPIRDQIRAELEATRIEYHKLVDSLSDQDWHKKSGNPAWTIGQLLFHMTLAPRLLPSEVRLIRKRKTMPKLLAFLFNQPGVIVTRKGTQKRKTVPRLPALLFNQLNVLITRIGARNVTRRSVGEKYDAAHAAALNALETIEEHEWSQGVHYPGWDRFLDGHVTLERLFRYLAVHFEVHAEQIRQGLEQE